MTQTTSTMGYKKARWSKASSLFSLKGPKAGCGRGGVNSGYQQYCTSVMKHIAGSLATSSSLPAFFLSQQQSFQLSGKVWLFNPVAVGYSVPARGQGGRGFSLGSGTATPPSDSLPLAGRGEGCDQCFPTKSRKPCSDGVQESDYQQYCSSGM